MEKVITGLMYRTSSSFIRQWCIVLLILIIVILIIGPKILKSLNGLRNKVNYGEDVLNMIANHDKSIKDIDDKLARDYRSINKIQQILDKQEEIQNDSLQERALLMRSMLAALKGIQELGANGTEKSNESIQKSQAEIEIYLNKQAHEPR